MTPKKPTPAPVKPVGDKKKRTKPVGKSGEPFKSGGYTPTNTTEEKGKK